MTLDQLIERLEELRDEIGTGDGEVKIATQPGYPLANCITNVVTDQTVQENRDESDRPFGEEYDEDEFYMDIWIATDQSHDQPYAPSGVWEA